MSVLSSSPSPPLSSLPKSLSKSEQLAKAVAESQASPRLPFRPDSLWLEGGADVVWQGFGAGKDHLDAPLASPAALSTHTVFSSTTDSSLPEFADAYEGRRSDDEDNWDGENTTTTTMSTSDSRKGSSTYPPLHSTPVMKAPPPARPRRKAPARLLEQTSLPAADSHSSEEEEAADTRGHGRTSSVGSSIWAGRGTRRNDEEAPPLPFANAGRHAALLQENTASGNTAKYRQSSSSSVYSNDQSPTQDGKQDSQPDQDRPSEEKENRGVVDDGKRRLADGTIVPKMPPMPTEAHFRSDDAQLPRSRSKKGRQTRSPILSYADGAEEEERLEQEREMQRDPEVTSSRMGPRLKKNSPAPWEMGDEGDVQSTHEVHRIPSRPSGEQLMPPDRRFGPSWATRSVESLRNRSLSQQNQQQQQQHHPPMPSSLRTSSAATSKERIVSTSEASSDAATSDHSVRRSRAKSVSNQAAGMLKGLGLTSSSGGTALSSKKSSKFGKALRGMGAGTRSSSSSSLGANIEARKSQGISSDDFAHLPPSPLPDQRFTQDADRRVASSTYRSVPKAEAQAQQQRAASANMMPVIIAAERQSSSADSHTGTSTSYATNCSSQHTALTSPGLPTDRSADQSKAASNSSSLPLHPLSLAPSHHAPSADRAESSSSPPRKAMVERPDSATPTLSPSKSSAALRPESSRMVSSSSSQGLSSGPTPFENTPYKLISLEEARRQQNAMKPSTSRDQMVSSSSNKSLDQNDEAKDEVPQLNRHLKNKKSGFLRRFAKDKMEQGEQEAGSIPDLPSFHSDASEDVVGDLRPFNGQTQTLAAPALSLRPMSSMFNGFAPGMLDTIDQDYKHKSKMSSPNMSTKGQPSPVFTFTSSLDGNNSSRASSQAVFEDATEQLKSPNLDSKATLPSSRLSAESLHSNVSSVPGFATASNTFVSGLEGASATTKTKAAEIEAKIAELMEQLVKLRGANGATDAGSNASSPVPSSAHSPLMLSTPTASCANCGCSCADQKRLQVASQVAAIKAAASPIMHSAPTTTSVLSRGRALKPLANADASKFGSNR